MLETQVWSLGQEDPLEKEMATIPVLLPGKSHGQRSLVGYSPWSRKESDMTERLYYYFTKLLKHNSISDGKLHQQKLQTKQTVTIWNLFSSYKSLKILLA